VCLAFLRHALLLKLDGERGHLLLEAVGKGRFERLIKIVVKGIGKVLILRSHELKLAQLGELEPLFKTGQLLDVDQLTIEHCVQCRQQLVCLRVNLPLGVLVDGVQLVRLWVPIHVDVDQKFAEQAVTVGCHGRLPPIAFLDF